MAAVYDALKRAQTHAAQDERHVLPPAMSMQQACLLPEIRGACQYIAAARKRTIRPVRERHLLVEQTARDVDTILGVQTVTANEPTIDAGEIRFGTVCHEERVLHRDETQRTSKARRRRLPLRRRPGCRWTPRRREPYWFACRAAPLCNAREPRPGRLPGRQARTMARSSISRRAVPGNAARPHLLLTATNNVDTGGVLIGVAGRVHRVRQEEFDAIGAVLPAPVNVDDADPVRVLPTLQHELPVLELRERVTASAPSARRPHIGVDGTYWSCPPSTM